MVSFSSVKDMKVGDLFGVDAIPATQLTKKLWAVIKEKNLRIIDMPKAETPKDKPAA